MLFRGSVMLSASLAVRDDRKHRGTELTLHPFTTQVGKRERGARKQAGVLRRRRWNTRCRHRELDGLRVAVDDRLDICLLPSLPRQPPAVHERNLRALVSRIWAFYGSRPPPSDDRISV